mmetsp:Transcript_33989/g.106516  ORF Transcript_33989/g.106516 Transcript_33989/m.106516 type:complete len:315 (+) Transcript_33989:309-1253(+)
MEVFHVAGKADEERTADVGILDGEGGMLEQLVHNLESLICTGRGLDGNPLAEHKVVVLGVLLVKVLQRLVALLARISGEAAGSSNEVGHAVSCEGLLQTHVKHFLVSESCEVAQTDVLKPPHSDCLCVIPEGIFRQQVRLVGLEEMITEASGDLLLGKLVGVYQCVGVHDLHALRQVLQVRQGQGVSLQRLVEGSVQKGSPNGVDKFSVELHGLPSLHGLGVRMNCSAEHELTCFPAIEAVLVMCHQERQLLIVSLVLKFDGSAEAPQERQDGLRVHVLDHKLLTGLLQLQHSFRQKFGPVLRQESNADGHVER